MSGVEWNSHAVFSHSIYSGTVAMYRPLIVLGFIVVWRSAAFVLCMELYSHCMDHSSLYFSSVYIDLPDYP